MEDGEVLSQVGLMDVHRTGMSSSQAAPVAGATGRPSVLSVSLYAVAAGVLAQAVLAGLFLSTVGEARLIHVFVGAVLPYMAIVPAVSAWRRARDGVVTRGFATAATVLLVGLWVQEALGHMPFPVTTVIHVPLGVLLFALALLLAIRAHGS